MKTRAIGGHLGHWVLSHRKTVLALWALATVLLAFMTARTRVSTDYRVFFSPSDPKLGSLLSLEQSFGKTDNIAFVIKPRTGDVFEPGALAAIQKLTTGGWKLPYASRVDSLTNYQWSRAEAGELRVGDLVEGDPSRLGPAELERARVAAKAQPMLYGLLLAKDLGAAGVNVTLRLPQKDPAEVKLAAVAARKLADEVRAVSPNLEIRISGMAMMNDAFMETSVEDMSLIFPLMGLVILLALWLILRGAWATFSVTVIVGLSALGAFATAGLFGYPLTPPSAAAPTIVLTLAVADGVHLVLASGQAYASGLDRRAAIIDSLRHNLGPILMTSSTTMFGFLGLDFAEAPPVWHLANMTTIGIGVALLASLTLLPVLLSFGHLPQPSKARRAERFWLAFGEWVIQKRAPLLIGGLGISIALGAAAFTLESNDQFLTYFDKSIAFRPDTEFFMKNLTGIYSVDYEIGSHGPSGIAEPAYLSRLAAFTEWLRQQPEVRHVASISDIVRQINANLHGDDPAELRLPATREEASQQLLLYSMSLPFGLDVGDRINVDQSSTRITATLTDLSSAELRAFAARSESWLEENTPKESWAHAISPAVIFSQMSDRNSDNMMRGNLFTLLLVGAAMIFSLGSLRLGLVSLIPNLMPIAIAYGLWAIFVGELNICASAAGSIALGIVVDDTIHTLHKYKVARLGGASNEAAVRAMLVESGPALVGTALVLLAGFGVLMFSGFQMTRYLGILVVLILGPGVFADLLILPPLLMALGEIKLRRPTLALFAPEVSKS